MTYMNIEKLCISESLFFLELILSVLFEKIVEMSLFDQMENIPTIILGR